MNFLPSFQIWPFAVAGFVCAAGPILIHLLNRRRYRVVRWAAMDFLREALQRNRRILQLRDLLLLLLRTAAVLLVGLALAQPFFARNDESYDGTKPLHAVLLIDNSLSMGYQSLEGTLLDRAKARAKQYIDKLPIDSRVSVIPVCGSRFGYSPDAYTAEQAQEALQRIEVVDRTAQAQQALNEAKKACDSGPQLGKRIVLFGDQQLVNWRDLNDPEQFRDLPSVQVVEVSADVQENTWISDLRIQDGLADVETPATFIVELRHEGPATRENLQVTLFADETEVGSKTVTLEPGLGAREVAFEYSFNAYRPEPERPVAVALRAVVTPDRLPADDERCLVIHVVAALPVVFVDQYGDSEEDAARHKFGETRDLRRLLVPVTSRTEGPRQLVKVRHVKLDELTQDVLADARLVVLAGLTDPGSQVELLRQYVVQGGQLVLAAGGEYNPALHSGFDPERWTETAWLDGAGILPVPMKPGFLGATPREQGAQVKPFFLSYESLQGHPYFRLAGTSEDELRDLYAEPFFFKAVQPDVSDESLQKLQAAEVQRLDEEFRFVAEAAARSREASARPSGNGQAKNGNGDRSGRTAPEDEERLRRVRPTWLLWSTGLAEDDRDELPEDPAARQRRLAELADRSRPRVLARFNDPAETPFLVERRIGRGTVLLVASGVLSDWNTLPKTNAMLIFDRILRSLVESTLPARNFAPQERVTLPVPPVVRDATVLLTRPGAEEGQEVLETGYIGREQLGVTVPRALTRGLYQITASRRTTSGVRTGEEIVWQTPLAVDGSAAESELTPILRDDFETRLGTTNVRWVGSEEEISLAGSQVRGQESWWWLILVVLGLLALELLILAAPLWRREAGARNGTPLVTQS